MFDYLIENLADYDASTLLVSGIVLILIPLATIIYLKVNSDPDFVKNLMTLKYRQKGLIVLIRKNLEHLDSEIHKLNLDIKTLEMFNTDHTRKLLDQIKYAEISSQFIYLLNNQAISDVTKSFLEETKATANKIYELEENLYRKQFEYNTNVISNSNKLLNDTNRFDMEDFQDFKKILSNKKEELTSLINETDKERKALHFKLVELAQTSKDIQTKLDLFEKNNIDAKRFYFRYLSFI
ncbi:hypothetical protein A2619_02090 [candidate division WWE3 bacterium RIFOXYD1_FULL_39_9]|uniref:Uncharacterized protein n=1 Tax=candidate division WWE3 bacterium RIFOXYD1_FULL_39_9 TaxID=1802649 RepID=A0A1F4X3E0_UNCKA|nr:MAG: hypothetical protein A2619_02090 [candidate division WWE3 bacterium RIFOXYD1_FULL_39_9]